MVACVRAKADRRRLATGDVSTLAVVTCSDVVVSPDGSTVYVTDDTSYVRAIAVATGQVSTFFYNGSRPSGIAISLDGATLYVTFRGTSDHIIRAFNVTTGESRFLAGSVEGSADGVGAAAKFSQMQGAAVSPDGSTVYVADAGNKKVRKINVATGTVSTLAGSGAEGSADGEGDVASFLYPFRVAVSPGGATLYVGDAPNNRVRAIVVDTGVVSTLAGSGSYPLAVSVDGVGTDAKFNNPRGVAVSYDGSTLYVAEPYGNKIRAINVDTAEVTTIGGTDEPGSADGAVADARFNYPIGVATSPDGSTLYVADTGNQKVRKVELALASPSSPPPSLPPPGLPPPSFPEVCPACGPGTARNPDTNTCEVVCDHVRRLAEEALEEDKDKDKDKDQEIEEEEPQEGNAAPSPASGHGASGRTWFAKYLAKRNPDLLAHLHAVNPTFVDRIGRLPRYSPA